MLITFLHQLLNRNKFPVKSCCHSSCVIGTSPAQNPSFKRRLLTLTTCCDVWRRREGTRRRQLAAGPAGQRSVCLGNANWAVMSQRP